MKITVTNELGNIIYPFPRCITIRLEKIEISIGILPMATDYGWEDYIMYRHTSPSFNQLRILIFAIGWRKKWQY